MVSLRLIVGSLLLLAFVVGVPVVVVLMIAARPDPGDCVTAAGADGSVSVVSCTDPSAQGIVLQRLDADDAEGDCTTVPGSTEQVPINVRDIDEPVAMCVGPKDVPPELSPAVAVPGGCLTDVRAEPVRQTFCSDPGAYRILARGRDDLVLMPDRNGCRRVPGSTETYLWQLVDTGFGDAPMMTRAFCVAPADPDTAPPDRVRPDN